MSGHRRRRRRSGLWTCQHGCGEVLRAVGTTDVGVQILKCPACGRMDRRLPVERRRGSDPLRLDPPTRRELARTALFYVLAAVAMLVAFWGALEVLS